MTPGDPSAPRPVVGLGRFAGRSLALHTIAAAGIFYLYRRLALQAMARGVVLGALTPERAVPLYALPQVDLGWWTVPAVLALVHAVVVIRAVLARRIMPAAVLLPLIMVLAMVTDVLVAMNDGGLDALVLPYTRLASEYFGDVPKISGFRSFLRDYAEIFPTLSGHARTHPPGGELFLWLVSRVIAPGLIPAALGTVAFGVLVFVPVYFLARDLHGERTARIALCLLLVTPNVALYTATSMDGPFAVFPVWATFLFFRSLSTRPLLYGALTGLALALGMFMSYATVFIGVFMGLLAVLVPMVQRDRGRNALIALPTAGSAFILFYVVLYLWADFNAIEAFLLAYRKDEANMGTGYETARQYWHLSVANLSAFLIGVGIPLTVLWLREFAGAIVCAVRRRGRVDAYTLAGGLTVLLAAFSTLFTLETERIWVFMAPFLVIPAARLLDRNGSPRRVLAATALLAVQILVTEVCLYTSW